MSEQNEPTLGRFWVANGASICSHILFFTMNPSRTTIPTLWIAAKRCHANVLRPIPDHSHRYNH